MGVLRPVVAVSQEPSSGSFFIWISDSTLGPSLTAILTEPLSKTSLFQIK